MQARGSALVTLVAGFLSLAHPTASSAQTPPRELADQAKAHTLNAPLPSSKKDAIRLVFVTVRDGHGKIVSDLGPSDFRLMDNGREQKTETFGRGTSVPLLLGLALDLSGSQGWQDPSAGRSSLRQFLLDVLRPGDLGFAVSFTDRAYLEVEPTGDTEELAHTLRRVTGDERGGGTALYDALYATCTSQMKCQPGRKVLVVLTDFLDNASHETLDAVIEIALRTETTIYPVVAQQPERIMAPQGVTIQIPGQLKRLKEARQAAQRLAEATGGRALFVEKKVDLRAALGELAEELWRQYVLGFVSPPECHDGELHHIHVQLTRKGLRATMKSGYYASKP